MPSAGRTGQSVGSRHSAMLGLGDHLLAQPREYPGPGYFTIALVQPERLDVRILIYILFYLGMHGCLHLPTIEIYDMFHLP